MGGALAIAALLVASVTLAEARRAAPPRPAARPSAPERLSETGLYSEIATGRVAAGNLPYAPQYALWSDGAEKRRWIFVPPGTAIDARDPEAWRFPVGTKLWKEFAWRGKRVETRLLQRTAAGWAYSTYVWDDDGSDAVLAPSEGVDSRQVLAGGRHHRIPGVDDCRNCHQGGRTEVLGFGALQLSPDRDPLAPHAEPLPAGALTLPVLAARGLLRNVPRALLETPPRILAPTPRGRAALGYLHGNCGGCHDTRGPVASVGLALRHDLAARNADGEPAAAAIGHGSRYRVPGASDGESAWIRPGDPAHSTVLTRMASRSPAAQMPPLGSQLVDEEAVALLAAWIREDLAETASKSSTTR